MLFRSPNTTNAVFQGNLTITGALTIGQNTITITETSINLSNSLQLTKDYIKIPSGNTAQRPSSAVNGTLRYNSETKSLEQYADAWVGLATPPAISSVTPSTFNGEQGTQFTIAGQSFDANPSVKFITANGTEVLASVLTVSSSNQLIATTPRDFTVAEEPLSVKVTNSSGLYYTLSSAIDCGGVPAWSNASGTLASVIGGLTSGVIATTVATDPDANATLSYSLSSGTLPPGLSVGSSNGNIFGTTQFLSSNTTYNFDITATDNAGNYTPRSFNIIIQKGTEPGGGAGYFTGVSDATVANQVTNNGMTLYYANAQAASPNNPTQWLNFTYSLNSFMIHTGHDGVKPTYLCVNVTSGTPRVLNRYRWYKHTNACGNIDFYGSNQSITSGNYQTLANWTYLGRGFMGGYGSEGDGTVKTATFNSSNYGYRWYMVLVRDYSNVAYSYPTEGTMSGYAMYGATFDCV